MLTCLPARAMRMVASASLCVACGASSASPAGPQGRMTERTVPAVALRMTATPDPVTAGARLTYRIEAGHGTPIAPHLTLHLPVGATGARTSGGGWTCAFATRSADQFQTGEHIDGACSSVRMGIGISALTVTVDAPTSPGSIRACSMAAVKRGLDGSQACAASTVVP